MFRTLLLCVTLFATATAWMPSRSPRHTPSPRSQSLSRSPSSSISMVPRFDPETQRWSPESPEDLEGAYGPLETLLRNGPLPFIQRLVNADTYDQGVLKFMANEGVGRQEAQGNLDASLENPNDWAYQKQREREGATPKDYASPPSVKDAALATAWAAVAVYFFGTLVMDFATGKYGPVVTFF